MTMTRANLKKQVNEAYDTFLDGIEALAKQYGIMPPSVRMVDDDPRTTEAAAALWQTFKARQDWLNEQYADPAAVKAKTRAAREKRATAIRTAEGLVTAAEETLREQRAAAAAAEKAGVEPDTQAVTNAEDALTAAKANLATVLEDNNQ